MKIAQIAAFLTPLSERLLGSPFSIPMIAYLITEELVARGHEVTVFAPTDSETSAKVAGVFSSAWLKNHHLNSDHPPRQATQAALRQFLDLCIAESPSFDIIHNHLVPVLDVAPRIPVPIVTTFHYFGRVYHRQHRHHPNHAFAALSERQKKNHPNFPIAAVIPHGIRVEDFRFVNHPESYFAWFGRISPVKGALEFTQLAKRFPKLQFKMAGNIEPAKKTAAYTQKVLQQVKQLKNLTYLGPLNLKQKVKFLGRAKALIALTGSQETFGLVSAEALACGTPIIGFHRGPLPEIVEQGKTGFLARNPVQLENMLRRIDRIEALSRHQCRKSAERRFSVQRMVTDYEHLYHQLISRYAHRTYSRLGSKK